LGAIVLNGTTLFPSKDGLTFDVIGLWVLDVIGLTDGLDQCTHLVREFGNENHSLEMRRDGAFGCCHSGESYEDGIDSKSGIGVSGDDDIHRRFEFFICGSDPRFAVGLLEVLPGQGSEHGVNIGVLFDGFLEEVQNCCSDSWVKVEHDVSESFVVDVEPGVDLGLVFGGFGCIFSGLGFSFFDNNAFDLVVGGRKFVLNNFPLALGEQVVHHHWLPGLPVHGTVQDRHKGHEGGGHCFCSKLVSGEHAKKQSKQRLGWFPGHRGESTQRWRCIKPNISPVC